MPAEDSEDDDVIIDEARLAGPLRKTDVIFEGPPLPVSGCTVFPDCKRMLFLGDAGSRVFCAETGKLLAYLGGPCPRGPHLDAAARIVSVTSREVEPATLPAGDVAMKTVTAKAAAFLSKAATRKAAASMKRAVAVTGCVVCPTGELPWVLIIGADGGHVWDVEGDHELVHFRRHVGWVHACAAFPDGQRVVTVGADGNGHIWEAMTGQELVVLRGHAGRVNSCAITPDGARVLTAGDDGLGCSWDAATGQEIARLVGHGHRGGFEGFERGALSCAAFPDSKRALTVGADSFGRVWEVETGRELVKMQGHWGSIFGCCVFRMPDTPAWLRPDREGPELWLSSFMADADAKHSDTELPDDAGLGAEVRQASLVEDTGTTGTPHQGHTNRRDEGGAQNDSGFHRVGGQVEAVPTRDWDKKHCALTVGEDGSVRIWNCQTGQEIHKMIGHAGGVTGSCMAFRDGNIMLTVGCDGTVRLWDPHVGHEVGRVGGLVRTHAAPFPDGSRVVTVSEDGEGFIWDFRDLREELAEDDGEHAAWCGDGFGGFRHEIGHMTTDDTHYGQDWRVENNHLCGGWDNDALGDGCGGWKEDEAEWSEACWREGEWEEDAA